VDKRSQVKEPLAPFGIARCRVWSVACRDQGRVEGVDVGMVADAEAAKEEAKRILMETKIADATRVGLLNEEGVEVFKRGPEPLMLRGRATPP
jgi:methyl coenzyme M reductase gamma subunit